MSKEMKLTIAITATIVSAMMYRALLVLGFDNAYLILPLIIASAVGWGVLVRDYVCPWFHKPKIKASAEQSKSQNYPLPGPDEVQALIELAAWAEKHTDVLMEGRKQGIRIGVSEPVAEFLARHCSSPEKGDVVSNNLVRI